MLADPTSTATRRFRSTTPFVIRSWEWRAEAATLICSYRHGDDQFAERFTFPVASQIDDVSTSDALQRAFDLILVAAGVSYYKLFASTSIVVEGVAANQAWKGFVEQLYDNGLREFAVTNGLSVPFVPAVSVPAVSAAAVSVAGLTRVAPIVVGQAARAESAPLRPLVPMGGGRDSLLVVTALIEMDPLLVVVGTNRVVEQQAKVLGLPLLTVSRHLDPAMLVMNRQGAMNGHVPVTAINSTVALAVAVMSARSHVVMSNEHSASEPTRVVEGVPVNHQYSKGIEFEKALRAMSVSLDLGVGYFSALRPYGELAISRAIGSHWQSLPPFISCNRAFVRSGDDRSPSWCTRCAKCYFVFLGLAPFVARARLVEFFGRDLLASSDDIEVLRSMLVGESRAFDCIGTTDEIAAALSLASTGDWADSSALVALAAEQNSAGSVLGGIPGLLAAHDEHFIPNSYRGAIEAVFR